MGFYGVGVIGCLTDFPSEPKQVQSTEDQHRHHDARDQLIEFCAEKSAQVGNDAEACEYARIKEKRLLKANSKSERHRHDVVRSGRDRSHERIKKKRGPREHGNEVLKVCSLISGLYAHFCRKLYGLQSQIFYTSKNQLRSFNDERQNQL